MTYPIPAGTFEDDSLFPMVGYVGFLEGICLKRSFLVMFVDPAIKDGVWFLVFKNT